MDPTWKCIRSSTIFACARASSAEVASSQMRISGWTDIALAIAAHLLFAAGKLMGIFFRIVPGESYIFREDGPLLYRRYALSPQRRQSVSEMDSPIFLRGLKEPTAS